MAFVTLALTCQTRPDQASLMSYKFMIIASLSLSLLGSHNEMQRERCQWGGEGRLWPVCCACVVEVCITIVFLPDCLTAWEPGPGTMTQPTCDAEQEEEAWVDILPNAQGGGLGIIRFFFHEF